MQRNRRLENVHTALVSAFAGAAVVPESFLSICELIGECHDQTCILDYFRCSMENGENALE